MMMPFTCMSSSVKVQNMKILFCITANKAELLHAPLKLFLLSTTLHLPLLLCAQMFQCTFFIEISNPQMFKPQWL